MSEGLIPSDPQVLVLLQNAALELEGPEPLGCPHRPTLVFGPSIPHLRPALHVQSPYNRFPRACADPGSACPRQAPPSSHPSTIT